ncbi:hypothetical protein [Actinomadura rugatobispora]|uniref:HEAT repeat domain-containing protein n=1 Tax=Actinomadura rugatobispora TaxID=1994 RepID=A0ABW0ZVJ6_9ACTN|nr:hypothetical protein GCM10010200_009110 [Actinomadura rugatobispora]
MRADELLAEIEPLAYSARCRRLADLRRIAGSAELRDLLDELDGRGHYERSLALFAATAVRDEASIAHIARTMRDPATDLAFDAVRWAVRLGAPPEPFEELLRDAPSALRAAAYEAVRRYRRADLAERLIDGVAELWGAAEAAALLPACGEEAVRERLDGLAHAVPNWKSLGTAHPDVVLDYAERQLERTPDNFRGYWWAWHGPGVAAAVPHDPGRVLALLERHWGEEPPPYTLVPRLGELLKADPERTQRLLLAKEHRRHLPGLLVPRAVRERLIRLGDLDEAAFARAVRENTHALTLLLKAAPPSRRDELFTAAMTGVDLSTAELDQGLMEVLPHAARAREARRTLGLTRVAQDHRKVWYLTSFLPYDEALPVLGGLTRRPDADERATGYQLLIMCAGRARSPEVLTRLLDQDLGRLRNEQDPVRLSALSSLAALPTAMLRAAHVPAFARMTGDALTARDCSYGTRDQLTRLAVALCRQGAADAGAELLELAFDMLRRLAGQSGTLRLGRLRDGLPKGRELALGRALAAHLDRSGARDDHRLVLALARALRDRAAGVPEIQQGLERALDARDDGVIREAIGLWLAAPRARAERVGRVVEKDPSTVLIPAVFNAIARDRTDLLNVALSDEAPPGRFRHPDVRYVPLADPPLTRRWTGRQQEEYRDLLHRIAASSATPTSERGRAVSIVARVPGATPDDLRRYYDPHLRAYFEEDDAYLSRLALTSSVWLAAPGELLPDLLDLASSDDAHVAMYAASRATRFVAPSELTALLAPVLTDGKITARKEALRILLRNRVPDAMGVVAAAWDDPGQHRDVRAAIASAARDRLDDPRALRILEEAARGPRDVARQVIDARPYMVEEKHRPRFAELVLDVARSDDPEASTSALPWLHMWATYAPGVPALLAGHLTDLDRTGTWDSAFGSLFQCVQAGHGLEELAAAVQNLAAARDARDAEAERDLPAAQRLASIVGHARTSHGMNRAQNEPVVRALDGCLPEPLASELLAATLPWDAPDAEARLDALAARPIGGAFAVERVARSLAFGRHVLDLDEGVAPWYHGALEPGPEAALPHAVRLASRDDLASGLFACALADTQGPRAGWPEEWRAVLRRLRVHPNPDVTYAARTILTAEE